MATSITNTSVTTDNLTVDTSTIHVDSANNRVGIGTTSPNNPLEISHTGSVGAGGLRIGDPSTIASDTGIYLRTTGDAVIGAAGGDIVFDTNMAVQEDMRINSNGQITMPNQPAFGMTTTVNSGMVAANSDIILNAGYNGGNHVNTSTGIFTAPVAGRYYFSAFSIKNNSSGTVGRLQIRQNGSVVAEARMDESGNYCQAHCSILINLAANDQINFRNNDATIFYMGGTYGRCNGYLVG